MGKVLVLGLGISGLSAVEFLRKKQVPICVFDDNKSTGFPEFSGDLSEIDYVVVSPGVPRTHPLYRAALERGIEVIGEVELAFRTLDQPVIAVTGTNGKTTVCLLVEHILKQAGRKAKLLGNSGVPLTTFEPGEIIVLELSSFQLETLKSPKIDAAAVLNVTPDHLDRYRDMEEYAQTKFNISRCLKPGGQLFVEERTFQQFGQGIPCRTYGLGAKTHDEENFMAAYALCRAMQIEDETIRKAYEMFKKPPHRIEFVAEISGLTYINDSKGTNIDAVIRCIQSLTGPIILIAGGVDKGASYTSWIQHFQGKVKMILTIGQAAEKIERELCAHIPFRRCKDLEEAVALGEKLAAAGDKIVLSPGCSSYDMFKDYAHRGDEFKRLVLRSQGR